LGAIIGDSEIRGQWTHPRAYIEDWEDIKFSSGAEPVPLERACQGGVEIYVHFVEDGCGPCGRVVSKIGAARVKVVREEKERVCMIGWDRVDSSSIGRSPRRAH
jgi:hypothetical protein